MKWSPQILSNLFIDDLDEQGLIFWYEAIKEDIELAKKELKKK